MDRRGRFTYDGYEYLEPIYRAIPGPGDLANFTLTMMKAAQCGASILSMLFSIYHAIRIPGISITYFLPDEDTALKFSGERYIELIRSNPSLHAMLTGGERRRQLEGSKAVRRIGNSLVFFGYVGGRLQTEAMPLDMLIFDEVQEMTPHQMEKARERVSASRYKVTLRLSTPKWPEADIHYYFLQSDQRYFHTRCHCEDGVVLSEEWPQCIGIGNGSTPGVPNGVFYVCPHCNTLIENPRRGRYVAHAPQNARHLGFHFAQTLVPTITAAELYDKFMNSRDLQSFYNRCLGRPYESEDQIPITEEILRRRVYREDIDWVRSLARGALRGTLMGVDHMGGFSDVWIMARTRDGRYRTVWVEHIESAEPFRRTAELMDLYGVRACAVENTPNYNEARRFALEFKGRVWIVSYQNLATDMVIWKDKAKPSSSQIRTDPAEDMPYLVGADQFRLMSYALGLVREGFVEMPDPERHPLMQQASVRPFTSSKGQPARVNIAEHFAKHLTRVALVAPEQESDLGAVKRRARVQKVGIDPHAAYAFMLACLASVRAYGVTRFLDTERPSGSWPPEPASDERTATAKQISQVVEHFKTFSPPATRCGTCASFGPETKCSPGWHKCLARMSIVVRDADKACMEYLPGEQEDSVLE